MDELTRKKADGLVIADEADFWRSCYLETNRVSIALFDTEGFASHNGFDRPSINSVPPRNPTLEQSEKYFRQKGTYRG